MKWLSVLSMMLLIISSSCSKPDHPVQEIELDDHPYPLKLIKEREVLLTEVGYPMLVYLNNPDHICVNFEMQKEELLLTYDRNLNIVQRGSITYGEGPLEAFSPAIMGGDEENVLVFDISVMRYYVFQNNFKKRIRLYCTQHGWIPHSGHYSNSKKTLLCIYPKDKKIDDNFRGGQNYYIYLRKWRDNRLDDQVIYKTWDLMSYSRNEFIFGDNLNFRIINDFAYILKKDEYRIMKFDLDGRLLKEIKVVGLKDVSFSKSMRRQWINASELDSIKNRCTYPEKLMHANGMLEVGGGIAVIRIKDYNPNNKQESVPADYFDLDLNYLGRIQLFWFSFYNSPVELYTETRIRTVGNIIYYIDTRETETDEEQYLTMWRVEK